MIPIRDDRAAARLLAPLLSLPDPARFAAHLRSLRTRFRIYVATCPVPLAEAGLRITPEIRAQSELYLPLAAIRDPFYQLYRQSLTYPPILSSTPFHGAASWADLYTGLPPEFQLSPDPSRLLEALLADDALRLAFLFHSFLPSRFYGGFARYPGQRAFLGEWLQGRSGPLRCLDAACGTGEESYGLARLLLESGWNPAEFRILGWTVEPLEVWAAACGSFLHDPSRTERFRAATDFLFMSSAAGSLEFRCADLLRPADQGTVGRFHLILCNGLLGGPILNNPRELDHVVMGLAGLLLPGGMLLTADSFHGGWKRRHPQGRLRVLLERAGLQTEEGGEGLVGTKPP